MKGINQISKLVWILLIVVIVIQYIEIIHLTTIINKSIAQNENCIQSYVHCIEELESCN